MPKFGNTSVSSSKPSISKCQTFTCFLRGARSAVPPLCHHQPGGRSVPRLWALSVPTLPHVLLSPGLDPAFPHALSHGEGAFPGGCTGDGVGCPVRHPLTGFTWCLLLWGDGGWGGGGAGVLLWSPCALGVGIKPAVVFCLCSAPSLQSSEVSVPVSLVPIRVHGAVPQNGEGGVG